MRQYISCWLIAISAVNTYLTAPDMQAVCGCVSAGKGNVRQACGGESHHRNFTGTIVLFQEVTPCIYFNFLRFI
jgi:hypothetical protein